MGEAQRRGGVIYDVDGTLLDTNYVHVTAWWEAFRERGHDVACADAVQRLLRRDPDERRRLARQQAEQFGWPAAVNGFLGAHGLNPLPRGGEGAPVVRVGT